MAKSNSAVQQRRGFGKFFRGVKAELKKVVWPTKKELINYTIVVFLVTIFIALIISVLDGLFAQLFNTLLHFVG
ncbi:preprotein translocase subunit SecE [Veillonella parvula]|uniref:preprotein translocase subunit SecE n=1 Tax=Veillonella parvula TaxID=29466 RepID=UPI002901FDF9|nr:preprotein translocase subunit SecE [Veillonella parvula]MDU3190911.1 preprotein translocase subunit SecE [Veillonella parvula]MDU6073376.1 preprotein translocase subunit SecE [Veillonella parvula]